MREILFRGKRADNENWVEGLLVKQVDLDGSDELCIQTWERDREGVSSKVLSVIPSTVGQYTGLTDKNGVNVFEGDILEYIDEDNELQRIKVVFDECAFLIEDSGIVDTDLLTSYVCLGLTVIGNIHDCPEMGIGDN